MENSTHKAVRIAIGILLCSLGIAISYGLITLLEGANMDRATMGNLASFAVSLLFGLSISGAGVLLAINPKIKGVKIW